MDVDPDSRIEGEQYLSNGNLIRVHMSLKQVARGDIVQVDWMVDETDAVSLGNWVRGGVIDSDYHESGVKGGQLTRALVGAIKLDRGWRFGTVVPEVSTTYNASGLYTVSQKSTFKCGAQPWTWELRTDDIPGWNIYLAGHNCALHAKNDCPREDYQSVFDAARANAEGRR